MELKGGDGGAKGESVGRREVEEGRGGGGGGGKKRLRQGECGAPWSTGRCEREASSSCSLFQGFVSR